MTATLSVRTLRLIVAPSAVLSTDAVTTVDKNGNAIISQPAQTPANEQQTGLDLSALDMAFKVKRTLKKKPNTAIIRVWGLSPTSRLYLSSPKKLAVSLAAGYDGENELLFLGQTRNSFSQQEGPENVTTFETGDSEKIMQAAGLKLTWGSQTAVQVALRAIQATIPEIVSGSQVSNWQKSNAAFATIGGRTFHPVGGAVDRKSIRYVDDICRSYGLIWWIDNGALNVMPKGGSLAGQELLISEDSGMVGSPSIDNAGFLKVKSLIRKGLHPGAIIRVQAANVTGDFRIDSCEYVGGNAAGHREWYAEMLCTNPKNASGQRTGF